jgi:MFS family permease
MPRVRVFDLLRELSPAKIFPKSEILSANYIYLLTLFIGDGIIMSTVTLYLKQRYGDMIGIGTLAVPVAAAGGILLALRAIVSACAAPLAGRWSDRRGMRWGVAGWGTLAAAAGCAFLAINGSIGLILVGISLASLGSGMLMAVLPAIVSSAAGGDQGGFAIGVLMTSGDFGCAIAPLIGYTLLGSISLSQQYLISAGLLITGGIVILATIRQSVAFSKKIRPV